MSIEYPSSDPKAHLLLLLQEHYADQSQLLIDLIENKLLGLDPFELVIDGISFSIEANDPELSKKIATFIEKLQARINARPKKNPDPEPEKYIENIIHETRKGIQELLNGVLEPQSEIVWQRKVTIDYNRSWQEFVDAGDYNFINSEFTEARFPIKRYGKNQEDVVERDLVIIEVKKDSRIHEVLGEMTRLGLEPANTEELLTIGELYPDLQRSFVIVVLGSSAPHSNGGTVVPVLSENVGERGLDLRYRDGLRWHDRCRFLARRK